jgi:hypothetical protein
MKAGNKNSRRENAIIRRTADLKKYVSAKNTDKAIKAYRDIIRTHINLKTDVPSELSGLIKSIGIDPNKIGAKTGKKDIQELQEEGFKKEFNNFGDNNSFVGVGPDDEIHD